MGTFKVNVPLNESVSNILEYFFVHLCFANLLKGKHNTPWLQQEEVVKDLVWPSPWSSPMILQPLLEWKRPLVHNASRCCGSTSRTITYKTQKTNNTSSQTKRWARSLEAREFVPSVWLSFWVPIYQLSKYT